MINESKEILKLFKEKEKITADLHNTEIKLVKATGTKNLNDKLKEVNNKISLMNKIMAWSKYSETKNAFKGELNIYNDLSTTDIVFIYIIL